MPYMALYRKFRPDGFDDVKGQDPIVTTLKNQIRADRVGHAYLFCGTRGTGKTTVAKIFARAVNCEHPDENGPCGMCASCRAIASGASMNVIEIDAASNNGVDNIREIRDEVAYPPTQGRYKVYIIDEVHMLSAGAFNALLKTLEEPPSYVIFILATTEANKIPVTILSRCQRYDFRRISADTITLRLKELTEKEGVEAQDKALRYVAKAADGSMRDALSLLDQCIAFYLDQELTYDRVLDVLGAMDTEVYSDILRKTMAGDIPGIMSSIEEMATGGKDFSQFVTDFTWYLRNLLLIKSSDAMEDVLDMSAENLSRLKEEAALIDEAALTRFIRVFSDLGSQLKYAVQKRILVEVAFIKLCRPQMETDTESLLQRIRALENEMAAQRADIASGKFQVRPQAEAGLSGSAYGTYKNNPGGQKAPIAASRPPKAVSGDVSAVLDRWKSITARTRQPLRSYLAAADFKELDDGKLCILSKSTTGEGVMSEPANLEELKRVLLEETGKDIDIVIAGPLSDPAKEKPLIDIEGILNFPIEYTD